MPQSADSAFDGDGLDRLPHSPPAVSSPLTPLAARDLMLRSYAELRAKARRDAAERGERVLAESVAVAAEAMRQAMGPTWDKPTRADLMVVKKRLDARLDFDRAPTAVQKTHDVNCLRVVEGLR